jgi:hypothetical protein
MLGNPDEYVQFGISDAELWALVGTSHSRAPHTPVDGVCVICAGQWPCQENKITTMVSRYSS